MKKKEDLLEALENLRAKKEALRWLELDIKKRNVENADTKDFEVNTVNATEPADSADEVPAVNGDSVDANAESESDGKSKTVSDKNVKAEDSGVCGGPSHDKCYRSK